MAASVSSLGGELLRRGGSHPRDASAGGSTTWCWKEVGNGELGIGSTSRLGGPA
jgi:hypothetical protein